MRLTLTLEAISPRRVSRSRLTVNRRNESYLFPDQYRFIVDYLADFSREMRKYNYGDAINKYFLLGRDLNQRDTIAVKRTSKLDWPALRNWNQPLS